MMPTARRGPLSGLVLLILLLLAPPPAAAQRLQCDRCHGELELLRQRVSGLAEAERLLVPAMTVHNSAHGELDCAECHAGTTRYPHAQAVTTRSCTSCHAPADSVWQGSVHARVQDRDPVGCTACHGVHDVLSRAQLEMPAGIAAANAKCAACHESQALAADDAHSGRALCASCHGAHDVQQPQRARSHMHPLQQLETCGGCHQEIAEAWRHDVHADTLRRLAAAGGELDPETLPGCTSCHSGHGMERPSATNFAAASVERCASCHEERTKTFFKSYHGKATVLGSDIAASCADCHGAHGILPSTDDRSRTHQGNLVGTCGGCHENARPAFVKYDSHPDPFNRARNPWIFASFLFMNSVLIMTLVVFGLHTALWWIRIVLDRRKGVAHGHGADHDTHHGDHA